ncbi:hypothetical protein [Verrucomicrobium sp. BvORR034]|uniref:hypothetical protein n=1 Tax=Verrucomicrobium sp. BvORR034 TaxID=1396418 RepID=UPI00067921C7|nr:hypothetical protein [Verrucomicrobium sp. BvORR034]
MPEIPLFNGGETVKTGAIPQMPLDNQRRPRADFRGIISGLGDVSQSQAVMAKAAEQPTLDAKMFAGLGQGYEALAKGISDVGGFLEKYAQKRQEVVNHRDITNGKAEMEGLLGQVEKGLDASHPEGWVDAFNQGTDQWRTEYAARKGISQHVKDEVLGALDARRAGLQGAIYARSGETAFKQSQAATENYVRMKAAAGDVEGVKTAVADAYSKNIFNLERSADTVARAAAQAGRMALMNAAEMQPGRTLNFLNAPEATGRPPEYENLPQPFHDKLRTASTLRLETLKEQAARQVKLGLAEGGINTAMDLAALPLIREQQDPMTAQRLVEELTPMVLQPEARMADLPGLYMRMVEHGSRDLRPDRELETQRLRTEAAMLPDGISIMMASKMDAMAQQPPGMSGSLHLGMRQINLMHESGFLNLAPDAVDEELDDADDHELALGGSTGGGSMPGPRLAKYGAGHLESSWQAFNLMRGLDHYASTLGRPITTKEVEKWVDEMTVVGQRHAGARAVLAAGERLLGGGAEPWV